MRLRKAWRRLLLIAFCAVPLPAIAQVQIDDLRGSWQQVQSNAGQCPTCRIAITEAMDGFAVAANNGWTATIRRQPDADGVTAAGDGRWTITRQNVVDQKTLACRFVLRGDRLYLTMVMTGANGARQVVRAVYERPAYGA